MRTVKKKTPSLPSSLVYEPWKRLDPRWFKLRKMMESGCLPEAVASAYGWTRQTALTHMSWMRSNWMHRYPKLRNSYRRRPRAA
jgi:hypothetical protein